MTYELQAFRDGAWVTLSKHVGYGSAADAYIAVWRRTGETELRITYNGRVVYGEGKAPC
jgi:hypothetical protein